MINFNYINNSKRMVILKCIGKNNFYIEKVLFPLENIVITAPSESRIEVWGNDSYSPKIEQRFRLAKEVLRIAA
tara:strand:+ start:3394 stop:3615 length:222 start_codon:yes stop_codon:yes gene_type:complete